MFRARQTCLPGGVQGNDFHLNDYVNQFDNGMREVTFLCVR